MACNTIEHVSEVLTRHQQKTRLQNLKGNDSLSSESASQQNQDGSGGDGSSDLGGVSDRRRTLLLDNIVSRVVLASGALNSDSGVILERELLH